MDSIDILCINCETLIPQMHIDAHCKSCTQPISQFSPPQDDLLQINQRLQKLKISLERFGQSSAKSDQIEVLSFLVRKCAELICIKSISLENLKLCLCINEGLKAYSKVKDNDILLLVNFERLKVCGKSKAKVMLDRIRKQPIEKNTFLFDGFENGELYKITEEEESRIGSELQGFCFSNLQSVVSLKPGSNLSITHSSVSSFCDNGTGAAGLSHDEMKKKFYAKCLKFRIKGIPKDSRIGNQEVENKGNQKGEMSELKGGRKNRDLDQISDLFQEALEKKIPIEKWDQFILENLTE